jgi:tetratricopeptide (TPR) repeat protein
MKQTILIVLSILIALSMFLVFKQNPLWAQSTDLAAAENLYRDGNYQGAADAYENLLRQGWTNGELFYNLGNSYYKMGSYGKAILNYERARRYLGGDPDVETNLKVANLRLFDRIVPLPRIFVIKIIEWIGRWFSLKQWGLWMILSEWLLLGLLIALHRVQDSNWRKLLVNGFLTISCAFLFTGGFFLLQKHFTDSSKAGIVLTDKIDVRSAPEAGGTEVFTLHEGAKVQVLREVSGWAEIRLADGKQGWLPNSAFEEI